MKKLIVFGLLFICFGSIGALISGTWYQDSVVLTGSGGITLDGDATVFDDVVVSLSSLKPPTGVTAPGWAAYATGPTALETYWFDPSSDECLDFTIQVPHRAKVGMDTYACHIHWTPRVTADGDPANQKVDWEMTYIVQDVGDDAPSTNAVGGNTHTPADANVVANRHYITGFTGITATDFGISAIIVARICRDADDGTNDTYEQDAGVLSVDCHMEIDSLGSDQEYVK